MKRILVVVLLATVSLCLLASPAVAGKKTDKYRPPEGVPILAVYGDGWWWDYVEATGDPNLDLTWGQAGVMPPTGDDELDGAWRPIPKDTVVDASFGWIGTTYGQTKNVAQALAISVDVTGPGDFSQHFSPAQVRTMWTGAFAFDEWWQAFAGGAPDLFNPKIMAGVYINRPLVPLGPFTTEGWYHFSWNMEQVLPITDHFYWDFDDPPDGIADSPGATHWPPGSNSVFIEFDFYVE